MPWPQRLAKLPFILWRIYRSEASPGLLGTLGMLGDAPAWLASMGRTQLGPMGEGVPLMNLRARAHLDRLLRPDWTVLEYGGGGSTAFFLARVARLVTIEHHPGWGEVLQQRFGEDPRWSLLLRPPGEVRGGDPAVPEDRTTSHPKMAGRDFTEYVEAIRSAGVEAFDLVLVDGRSRPACLLEAARHVRPGGYLLLDDSWRPHYQPAAQRVSPDAERRDIQGFIPYVAVRGQTTFWRMPGRDGGPS